MKTLLKFLAVIALLGALGWFIQTIIYFYHDMVAWSDPMIVVHGSMILYALMFLFLRNIPTLLVLFLCYKAFQER